MLRLNLILFAILIICSLGLVSSQHQARKLFNSLEEENDRAKQLEVEHGQLQLEQSTWAMHGRVERVARQALHMGIPDPRRTQIVEPGAAAKAEQPAGAKP